MLTRLEIDGFKTFESFALDVPPFAVILGPNASGKSNVFDALQLLSRLASSDLRSALSEGRGDLLEQFRTDAAGNPARAMRFAVEVLLPPQVRDPWGDERPLHQTRLRYEVAIELRTPGASTEGVGTLLRPFVASERVVPLRTKADPWRDAQEPSKTTRRGLFSYRRQPPFLETDEDSTLRTFKLAQDGNAGRKQDRPAQAAEATVLSSITTTTFRHLYALREELRSWRFLQLDPFSLRRSSSMSAAEELDTSGSNLPTVLARLRVETGTAERAEGVIADIEADLATLIPGITGIDLVENASNHEWELRILARRDRGFSSRVVSDGTLRLLALLGLLNDPRFRGLVCFEEPENGVHPARLRTLIAHLRDAAADFGNDLSPADPLPQILVNSHSPVVLAALNPGEAFLADQTTVISPNGADPIRRTRVRQVRPTLFENDPETSATLDGARAILESAQVEDDEWLAAT